MRDSFGRKINYLRVSLTDRCNLRCKYCMPEKGVSKFPHHDMLTLEETYEILKAFVDLGIDKIRFTGGEPLVRKGAIDLISKVSKLDGIKDLAMTTNGTFLKEFAIPLKEAGLNRVNISLDTLDKDKYKNITRGGNIEDLFKGIDAAKNAGLTPIKINTVLIGGFNDNELEDLVIMAEEKEIDIRFIELMPIGEATNWSKENFISKDIIFKKFKNLIPVENNDISSPARYYSLPNGKIKIGIIDPISCKFCTNCNRVRLTAKGQLKLCLHSNLEIDLKAALRNKDDIKRLIVDSIEKKQDSHHLEEGNYISRNMNQIGG